MEPVIAIVGRPNVGKSTLFNRLTRSREALVDDRPGVTRDRLYAHVRHENRSFSIVDTGGFEDSASDPLAQKVKAQVLSAIEESDGIVFVVDGREGILPLDQDIARMLRPYEKKVYVAINKIDGPGLENLVTEFYALGFPNLFAISAAHGYGIRALLEKILEDLPEAPAVKDNTQAIKVAVVGKPNVGKSSLINRILGSDRLVVSELPGTTRDSVDIHFEWKGKQYSFIDTAGIRRRTRVKEKIEKFSVIKALKSLQRCHLACVLIDATEGVTDQDARICGYALERGKAIVVVISKWDLVKHEQAKKRELERSLDRQLDFLSFAPKVRTSALTGEGIASLFQKIDAVYAEFSRSVKTAEVNRVLKEIVGRHPPAMVGRKRPTFSYASQVDTTPPTFVVFVNRPEWVQSAYERYLLNQFRAKLGFTLTPIRLVFKKKKK
ncbi:MAG: ribosome biogenesis GTPase Der [Deltaproteobacteria bacterium]|nr:MAG: ribosome biogenesis GTPase Der [Deltaproteobacteria bacterium]